VIPVISANIIRSLILRYENGKIDNFVIELFEIPSGFANCVAPLDKPPKH
jgi:hypothetical protein